MAYQRTIEEVRKLMFSKCYLADNGCWIYTGNPAAKKPRIGFQGKYITCARLSYILHKGKITNGLHVLHTCDNPKCLNPEHLFLGTNQDNMTDKVNKGRQAKGEAHGNVSLSLDQVIKIKELLRLKTKHMQIAKLFHISLSTVSAISTERNWRHLNEL